MSTNTKRIAALIRHLAGSTIFSCRFIKRTTGEERLMVCRLGVTQHLTKEGGEQRAYDPSEKGLLAVWDTQKKAYRSIPLDGIISIKINGMEYNVSDELCKRRCEGCNEPLPDHNETDLCPDCLGIAPHHNACTCGEGKCGYRRD